MATVDARGMGYRRAPGWPVAFLALCAILAAISLTQGIIDLVVPALTGREPFGFLFDATQRFGPNFFIGYIFVHNLGLATLVPGVGFLAAWFEKKTVNRGLIGFLLAGAVALSLLVTLQYLVQAQERFDMRFAIPLYVAEALAVMALALASAAELRGFVPTRTYQWSLVTPFKRLTLVLVASASILALLATLEAYILFVAS